MANQPKTISKYDIVGKLGKGAMGEVYKGHDPVLNRFVAIKVIAESLDTDPELVERFRREAKAAAQLNHPNIITIYDFIEDEGSLYIVMELLDGKDLKEIIKSGTPLTMEQILGMMEQIADGLGFAHENHMVHRDLKPANIHVTKKGQIKILDFGLVHNESSDMTKTGHVMGTPNYMSPEQVQGLKIDARSDIFSLGAVFYELLTRKKPFSGDSMHATMFKVVQGKREPLARYTHLPPAIIQMVDRALDPNVDGRFADGNALREYIRNIRADALARGDADMTISSRADPTITTFGTAPGSHPSGSSPSQGSARSQSQSAGWASGSHDTMRQAEMTEISVGAVAPTSKPIGLYVGGAAVVLAIAAASFYFTSRDAGSGPSVEELGVALVTTQQELMEQSLERRDYPAALAQARELLAADAQNAEALRVRDAAETALAQIGPTVAEGRAALERGASEEAADALRRVRALDPNHPLGAELNDQLNQYFQRQAESAQRDMTQARSAAFSVGATSRPEFQRAESLRQQASANFNRSEYTSAAQNFLAARDGYQQARATYQQAESALSAQSEQARQAQQAAQAEAEAQAGARAELEGAENAWTRLRSRPDEAGVTEQPSYQRAMSEEAAAKGFASSGDWSGAARSYQSATSYLEAARSEYREAEKRRVAEEARRAAAAPPPPTLPPPRAPPAVSSTPSVAQEEAAIREALATYERALESENLDLFRRIKPNLSADEAQRLQSSFDAMDSHELGLEIQSIVIEGDRATVNLTRRDVIVFRGRSNESSRTQTFMLAKIAGSWIITQIGQ